MSEETAPRMRSMRMNYRADDKTIVEFIEAQEAKSVSLRLLITLFMREHGAQDVTTVVSEVLNNHTDRDTHTDYNTAPREVDSDAAESGVELNTDAASDREHETEAETEAVSDTKPGRESKRESEQSVAQAETTPATEDKDSADKPPKAAASDISEMFK